MNLYNNLKIKVYLGLILGLVSIPVLASSETWEANLDLTIPSLGMPSTLVLDSKAKHAIMMGFECCWAQKHIDSVRLEHSLKSIGYSLRVNQKRLPYTHLSIQPLLDNRRIVFFTVLQVADIYTTYRGLKYDCVKELNPFLGETPSLNRLLLTKATIVIPLVHYDIQNGNLTNHTLDEVNLLMSIVVANNYDVYHKVKKVCNKR